MTVAYSASVCTCMCTSGVCAVTGKQINPSGTIIVFERSRSAAQPHNKYLGHNSTAALMTAVMTVIVCVVVVHSTVVES